MDKTDVDFVKSREERLEKMNKLLDKDDFDHNDYMELEALISDMEKEYYDLKKRYQKLVFETK